MLRYSEKKLEEENSITAIFFKAQKELESRKKLYEEFRRKYNDEELASLSDEDIKVPLQRYLGVMAVGFFAGMPPIYKVQAYDKELDQLNQELFDMPANNENKVKEMEFIIKHITDYNDDSKEFFSLAFDYFIKRAAYEILYKNNKGEYVYSKSDSLETVAIFDYSIPSNIIGLYRIITTTLADGEYQIMVELTTKSGKRYYMDTPEKRELFNNKPDEYKKKYGEEPLFKEDKEAYQTQKWDDLQIIAIESEHNLNIFESVDSLIKAYERVIQNARNTFKYNDEAILMVKGYKPQEDKYTFDDDGNQIPNPKRQAENEDLRTAGTLWLDIDGDAKWLLKDINDNALQNHKKTLMDLICLCSFIPNMTDLGFTQADNNSALEKKFFALQQLIADAEADFKKALNRRWELIFNKINKDKNKDYDFRNVQISLQRNMPSDKSSETSRAMSLRDLLSDETIIGMLPDDLDPKNEIAKKKTESETNLEDNQKLMQKFSQNVGNEDNNENLNNKVKNQVSVTPGEEIKGAKEKEPEEKPNAVQDLDKLKK